MKWLRRMIHEELHTVWGPLQIQVTTLEEDLRGQAQALQQLTTELLEATQALDQFKRDGLVVKQWFDSRIESLRDDLNQSNAHLSSLIKERDRYLRDDLELSVTGMTRLLDKRLEALGDKKGLVVDLLKRIAFLEGNQK